MNWVRREESNSEELALEKKTAGNAMVPYFSQQPKDKSMNCHKSTLLVRLSSPHYTNHFFRFHHLLVSFRFLFNFLSFFHFDFPGNRFRLSPPYADLNTVLFVILIIFEWTCGSPGLQVPPPLYSDFYLFIYSKW